MKGRILWIAVDIAAAALILFVLADIYVGDITCFQTAFAKDTYGVGYSEKLTDMSARLKSVLAVNGDSYSNNRHEDNGTIIRNGVIYRNKQTTEETCVLNWDGTMDIYQPGQIDLQLLIDKGAYQSWIFGPSLLDESGKAKNTFLIWDYIRQSHPRTAIGYYQPEHEVEDGIFIIRRLIEAAAVRRGYGGYQNAG